MLVPEEKAGIPWWLVSQQHFVRAGPHLHLIQWSLETVQELIVFGVSPGWAFEMQESYERKSAMGLEASMILDSM